MAEENCTGISSVSDDGYGSQLTVNGSFFGCPAFGDHFMDCESQFPVKPGLAESFVGPGAEAPKA